MRTEPVSGLPVLTVKPNRAVLAPYGISFAENLFDEGNKPISAKGLSRSVLLVSGGSRETVQLARCRATVH